MSLSSTSWRLIRIEGKRFRAKPIQRRYLMLLWKKLSREPFPKVRAFQLSDYNFNRIVELRRRREDMLRELEECDTILTTEGTDACVFNTDETPECDFMIVVRENPYHSLKEILKHESSHIARGDL